MSPDPECVEVIVPGESVVTGEGRRTFRLRPWNAGDLEAMGERQASAAARTTAILARCLLSDSGEPAGGDFVRGLSVGEREALQLRLRSITLGDRLDCLLTCPACREKMDLELTLSELLLPPCPDARPTHSRTFSDNQGRYEVRFRLPTGADQEAVAELARRDPTAAADAVLKRCIEQVNGTVVDQVPAVVANALPAVMAELDPQAELMLEATCPACETEFEALFDAALFVHQELDRARNRIHREVHLLAFHYHWSEAEILAMSDSRRRTYLELVCEELGRRREQAS